MGFIGRSRSGSASVRIDRIGWRRVQIPLKTAFAHARRERAVSDAIILWIETDLGITG